MTDQKLIEKFELFCQLSLPEYSSGEALGKIVDAYNYQLIPYSKEFERFFTDLRQSMDIKVWDYFKEETVRSYAYEKFSNNRSLKQVVQWFEDKYLDEKDLPF